MGQGVIDWIVHESKYLDSQTLVRFLMIAVVAEIFLIICYYLGVWGSGS